MEIREEVIWFSSVMEEKLKENDHKGGWNHCSSNYLSIRLTQERKELSKAIKNNNKEEIIKECADIANFAMMIADRFREK